MLVHGLGAPAMVMRPMQKRFEQVGYRTRLFGYPSLVGRIENHGRGLAAVLAKLAGEPGVGAIHLVTHSMGGIVARCALQLTRERIGRIVMLAPPNRGSPVATRARRFVGRALTPVEQLSQHEGSWIHSAPALDGLDVGIVTASHDWVIGPGNTLLPDQRDHIVIRGFHSPLVWQHSAFVQALHYLRHGRFAHA